MHNPEQINPSTSSDLLRFQQRAASYCARAERCVSDVEKKLQRWGATSLQIQRVIAYLIEHNYLNEARYALAFVRDHIRYNQWGPLKIEHYLRAKGVPNDLIRQALKQTKEEGITLQVEPLLTKRLQQIPPQLSCYKQRERLLRFALSRGIEPEQAHRTVNQLLRERFPDEIFE